jgi:hypothetical protein
MYDILDVNKTSELYLLRQGWFSPEYELTDKVYNYGKLSYHMFSRRKATATTASSTWIFKREGLFSRTILVTDENDVFIGKTTRDWFSRKRLLILQTGFQAEFYRPSIWSREYIWNSEGYGKIMHIISNPFNLKDTIYIDQSMTPASLIPLLIFLGGHLTILRNRRRAAHS